MTNPVPLSAKFRALFARDEVAFWFDHFHDDERKLARMDVWELAKVINEARVRNLAGEAEKLIVAEHLLNVRLAKIQATAAWGSGVLGFVGAIIGAALSVALTLALQQKDAPRGPERASEQRAESAPIQKAPEPVARPVENVPSNPVVEVKPPSKGAVSGPPNGTKEK